MGIQALTHSRGNMWVCFCCCEMHKSRDIGPPHNTHRLLEEFQYTMTRDVFNTLIVIFEEVCREIYVSFICLRLLIVLFGLDDV